MCVERSAPPRTAPHELPWNGGSPAVLACTSALARTIMMDNAIYFSHVRTHLRIVNVLREEEKSTASSSAPASPHPPPSALDKTKGETHNPPTQKKECLGREGLVCTTSSSLLPKARVEGGAYGQRPLPQEGEKDKE
jgi:hypothetical protein